MSDDQTLAAARFGNEVESFLSSPLGQFIKDQADRQCLAAMTALADTDSYADAEIRKLQNEIKVARSVMDWLAGAVQRGHVALRMLEAKEQTD